MEGSLKSLTRTTIVCLGVLITAVLGFAVKLFVIGEPADGTQLYCRTSLEGEALELQVDPVESAVALRGWSFKRDGNTLLIRARKVLVSPLFPGETFVTAIDLDGIETVSLGGQIIFEKDS